MLDWAEGQQRMRLLTKELYDALLWREFAKAKEICDAIVVEARLTKAQIGVQEERNV